MHYKAKEKTFKGIDGERKSGVCYSNRRTENQPTGNQGICGGAAYFCGNRALLPHRYAFHKNEKKTPQPLTLSQKKAVEEILEEWKEENPRPCLLKGVTGSGKTAVYMELIDKVLARGEQVIVLIPEIALTYQNVSRFYSRFGDGVSVMNSRLSKGERWDQFERAKNGEISIVIGPRSALFTPFPNLGLILIDEEHEGSYKSEKTPCYHARETAIERACMEHARVVLGSASPSVDSYYRGKTGAYKLVYLEERYGGRSLPKVSVVDLREELKTGNRSIFSSALTEKIRDRLEKKQQVLLF